VLNTREEGFKLAALMLNKGMGKVSCCGA